MQNDPQEIDHSIQLQPVARQMPHVSRHEPWPPAVNPPRQGGMGRVVIYLVIGGGLLLAIGAIAAAVGVIVRIGKDSTKDIVVTDQRDPASLRAESTSVFGAYDAVEQARAELGDEAKRERAAIDELFSQIEKCAAEFTHDDFKKLVDFDRLMKRVERTGNMAGWTYFDKRTWRSQIKGMAEAESYWADITVAGIVTPHDDPNTRIVYTYCNDIASASPSECRFWIARDGDSWKLYDWARLDLGLAESQEWGLYAKYAEDPTLGGFERWGELIGEADEAIGRNDRDVAKEKLRRAEQEIVPPEFQDFYWVLTGFRWSSLDENKEAERCYNSVSQPADTPGAYYGLLTSHRWKQPAEALKYAEQYEAAVGPCPELLETKAQLLNRLGRKEETAKEWRRLLRIKPDHTYAMSEFVTSLPIENQSAFESQLELLPDPVTSAVSIARSVGDLDYERLLLIAEYVNRKAPDTPGALYVTGLTQFLDGRYAEAAEHYHSASEKETDESKRESYLNDYIEAMAADGKVIEALRKTPNAKPALEHLYYKYEEEGLELTDDEHRQLVALNRELYPDDLKAIHLEAALALSEERYEDAVRVLQKALRSDSKSDEESEDEDYYRDVCEGLLATTLYRLDRWKEGYENVGERRDRFAQLSRMAADDHRWDLVRELLEIHRAVDAEDPQLHGVEGELAAHDKQWDDAVRHLRQGLLASADYESWSLKRRLMDVYIDSGRWLDHLKTSDDQGETFKELANRFVESENWDAITELIAEYRQTAADDIRIVQQQAEIAWHQENYGAYAQLARQLLHADHAEMLGYERLEIENRLMSALLRGRLFGQAWQQALTKQREENDVSKMAIVNAANGKLPEALRLALEAARQNDHAALLYRDSDTARIFLGNEFSELHNEFPVYLPYDATNTLAVFVFDKPQQLEAEAIYAAMEKLGIEIGAGLKPISSFRQGDPAAFGLKQGNATIWLAAGEGLFEETWRLENKKHPLVGTLKAGAGWLAVGTAALTESDRKQAEETARRLSAELVGDRAAAVCISDHQGWNFVAYPTKPVLIAEWQSTGKVKSFKEDAAPLLELPTEDVVASREFLQELRKAVRAFEASPEGRLEVTCCVSPDSQIDPLRLRVKKVNRSYGALEFEGVLVNDSVLVPELRAGLPMEFGSSFIREVQWNDDKPERRH